MPPLQADRISGVNLIIQLKIKLFELFHPVSIALSNISMAIIVAVKTIIASTNTSKIGQNHWLKNPMISSIPVLLCPVLLYAIYLQSGNFKNNML